MIDLSLLEVTANLVRRDIVKMLAYAQSGHSAGSLGMTDVLVALYFHLLNHDPHNPSWEDRDRVILSNGHICPVWYAVLARCGYFPMEELITLRAIDSRLQGHPVHKMGREALHNLPGVENTAGPLGQGVSVAVGLSTALKADGKKNQVVCLMGDGEQQEGQVWEALLFASKYRLSNLTFIVDCNTIQIDGHTYEVMPLEPLKEKYEAFGMSVIEIDGHNFEEIIAAFERGRAVLGQPTVMIAHTIPGKGVEFMEDDPEWHGKTPNIGETIEALKELSVKRRGSDDCE